MDKIFKEQQQHLIGLIDAAIEKLKKRKKEVKNNNRPQLVETLDRGIEILNKCRENMSDTEKLQTRLQSYAGKVRPGMGLSRGFGEFDCGDEVKDAVRAVEHYFRSM